MLVDAAFGQFHFHSPELAAPLSGASFPPKASQRQYGGEWGGDLTQPLTQIASLDAAAA